MLRPLLLSISLILTFTYRSVADGGMYPISMIDKVPLKQAGLRLSMDDIFNPSGQGLIKAVVQLGGCTGSFVSDKGLIITNHHCAFGGLQPYSSPENNLMQKGYLAREKNLELPINGLQCKIMESFKDVSADVLKGAEKATPVEKKKIIAQNIDKLKQGEQLKYADLQIDISEMLPGKSYVLFRYKMLKDIRIVYIPARNIGEFGGETDNWEWPRHNGDFSFVRAYVSRDGKAATFDSSNVPYQPKEFLNINASGVDNKDFVFILGYPGRTFRHQPAEFIKYHQNYQLPYISELFEWQINTIKKLGEDDPAYMIRMEPKVKRLANTEKNYKGKLKSMAAIDLYNRKKKEENELSEKLAYMPESASEYSRLLESVDSLYAKVEQDFIKYLWYNQLLSESATLRIAHVIDYFNEKYPGVKNNPEELQKLQATVSDQLRSYYRGMYLKYDTTYLKKMFSDAMQFKNGNMVPGVQKVYNKEAQKKGLNAWYSTLFTKSKLLDSAYVLSTIHGKPQKLSSLQKDPLVLFSSEVYRDFRKVDSMQDQYKAQLDALLPRYVDLKMEAMDKLFIPDANSTLRLTYGYIKGYSPVDAVYYQPHTTVAGMIAKNDLAPDYDVNDELAYIYKQNEVTPFHIAKKEVPLCILYNTDTTGGNSGSPILNKFGQLVGVNFDRSYEATINDYAWDDAYSRSIGVDIRFVLWTLKKVAKADHLLDEMFIDKNK